MRRRLVATTDSVTRLRSHPFFKDINGFDGFSAIHPYLDSRINILNDQVTRCNEIAAQTDVLISLIFNIATLQDTKAANALSLNSQRIAFATFIYLPLSLTVVSCFYLASHLTWAIPKLLIILKSIYGMNVTELIGIQAELSMWAAGTTAVCLTLLTYGVWYIWSTGIIRAWVYKWHTSITELAARIWLGLHHNA